MGELQRIAVLLFVALTVIGFASAAHTSSADLQPEWSPAGQNVDYTVTISNQAGGDALDEIRIYQHPDYTLFQCEPKDDWELVYVPDFGGYGLCWYYTNDPQYNIAGGSSDTFEFSATVPQNGCFMDWTFETRDEAAVGFGDWQTIYDDTSVDNLPPVLVKTVEGEQEGPCPPGQGETCWVTQSTEITVEVTDPSSECDPPSLVDYCTFEIVLDGSPHSAWTVHADDGEVHESIFFTEDSEHELIIECFDNAGNSFFDPEVFKVDDTAPETTHDFLGPYKVDDGVQWIDGVSTIELSAIDPDPTGYSCNIGVEDTFYRVTLVKDAYCWDDDVSCEDAKGDGDWLSYEGAIGDIDESCHMIEYYSVDYLGNEEDIQKDCFFVDKTPPAIEKKLEDDQPYAGECLPTPGDINSECFITSQTEIDLYCEDQDPHPSGDEVIAWKYRFTEDGENWSNWNPDQSACAGTIVDGWCEEMTQGRAISFPESSLHEMQWYCYDAVGKESEVDQEWFRVDNDAPILTKEILGPQVGDCPPANGDMNAECFIQGGVTEITLDVADVESIHASHGVSCTWDYYWNDNWYQGGQFDEAGTSVIFQEDSEHILRVICEDAVGNVMRDVERFLVDMEPPMTEKTLGEPLVLDYYPKDCIHRFTGADDIRIDQDLEWCGAEEAEFITPETPVTLFSEDEKVGVNATYWRNLLVEDDYWGEQICGHKYLSPQTRPIDVDTACANGDVSAACGGPRTMCNPRFYRDYVNNSIPWETYDGAFYKPEESCHIIEYYSVDHLGNEERLHWNCVFVDDSEPLLDKTVGQPQYFDGENLFVTQDTPITFTCIDDQPHPVDHVELKYRTRYADDCADLGEASWSKWATVNGNEDEYLLEYTLYFGEDSCHEIEYYCEDGLGNRAGSFFEVDVVDTVAPVTDYDITGPYHTEENCFVQDFDVGATTFDPECVTVEYIDGATRIELLPEDPRPHPSGLYGTFYRWERVDDEYCWNPDTCEAPEIPDLSQDSCVKWDCLADMDQEAMATGRYGNQVTPAQTWELAVGVPNQAPVDTEEYLWNNGQEVEWSFLYNSANGYIVFTVGQESVEWYYGENRAFEYIVPFAKGNDDGNHVELTDMYLNMIPIDDVESGDGYMGNRVFVNDEYQTHGLWLTGKATLTWSGINTKDEQPGFHVFLGNDHEMELAKWLEYDVPFGIDEESCHKIDFFSMDNLYNIEQPSSMCLFVDHTAPETDHDFGEPYASFEGAEWITSATDISLSAYDPEPHPSGVDETFYRWELAPDEVCENERNCYEFDMSAGWNTYDASFVIPETSCHVIEYYSVDNVQKTEQYNRQCVYVDNEGPIPNKTVGLPNGLWDGDGDFFQLQDVCNTDGGIDCWQVTTLTPVNMACNDPEPHPVNHNNVCFQVIYDPTETDDGDITDQYCEGYGELNDEGYCCVEGEIEHFLFGETSEHKLSYYCEDALGNRGPLDVEMFKVQGTAFEIELNKKWNLISVPFKLMDDNMDEVFSEVDDTVVSVWTYDAATGDWYVYTPDGDATNDNLNTMKPGWGYWLLSEADDRLIIGGSLFESGPSTPVSRPIVGGAWNLVGYYGKNGIDVYDGPDYSGDMALCHLNSIAGSIWTQDFTGLYGYWEPDQPDPFFGIGQYDRLDPGAGYWMFSSEDGVFAPSTTCGGIGGIIPIDLI